MSTTAAKIGFVTVSDRASRGEYEDLGGPAMIDWISRALSSPWEKHSRMVPDEQDQVEQALIELCDVQRCCLVVTTGGTGPALRDITPEATAAVCEKVLPGFGEQMRAVSLQFVPTAILSRQIAGIRGQSLIVNLPGHCRVSTGRISCRSVLHRSARGPLFGNPCGIYSSVSPQTKVTSPSISMVA